MSVSTDDPTVKGPAPAPAGDEASPAAEEGRAEKAASGKKGSKKNKGGKLGSSRGIETMFRTSYRTHMDLSSLADTKANIMISINGLIISIILGSTASKIDTNAGLVYPTTVLLLSCLVSIIYAVRAARPRVSSTPITLEDVRADRSNILFFGNFVNMSQEDYLTGMTELLQDTDRLYTNMMRDLYGLGLVLSRKFALLRVSYTAFMIGIFLSVISFVAYFIWIGQQM